MPIHEPRDENAEERGAVMYTGVTGTQGMGIPVDQKPPGNPQQGPDPTNEDDEDGPKLTIMEKMKKAAMDAAPAPKPAKSFAPPRESNKNA